jgi:mycothiol synthase
MPPAPPRVPAPLRARQVTPADLGAITDLYIAANLADLGRVDADADDVESIWRWPDFDLAADAALVVGQDGRPAGYAWVHRGVHQGGATSTADLVVAPEWRGRGVGRALLDWLVARARAQAAGHGVATTVHLDALGGDQAAARLLGRAGFTATRQTLRMTVDLAAGVEPAAWPAGVTTRAMTEADGRAVHALVQAAFADVEGWTPRPYEQWASFTLERGGFDPGLCVLALAGGELAGATVNQRFADDGGDEGFVQYLAVARAWRRRGLGRALLLASFGRMAAAGVPMASLYVDADNSTGATRMYERAGMREDGRWDRWEFSVAP